jgi:hypothetical protein
MKENARNVLLKMMMIIIIIIIIIIRAIMRSANILWKVLM